ncbi:MAG: homocysteine S-methyltransferase family protein, partial [Candidatus Coatesbacteria bacterium]|nr:homocysteine S-methyltransferase family protein [Candidatus Coatesbacteria bacterium]
MTQPARSAKSRRCWELASRFEDQLAIGRPLVVDGAMGTMLQNAGLGIGECPELWNLEHADRVQRIHEEYLRAGADIIVTNTFGGSPKKLKMFGLEGKAYVINRAGAELGVKAREACGRTKDALVFGSIGSTGELLEPLGTAT